MPGRVQNLLAKIDGIRIQFVLRLLSAGLHRNGFLRLAGHLRRLELALILGLSIINVERVVVRARQNQVGVTADSALELVEDAVILIQITKLGS